MAKRFFLLIGSMLISATAGADLRSLVPEDILYQIAEETSGEAAKRNLDTITLNHRMRASDQFDRATLHVIDKLNQYGLDEVGVLEYAADGETLFGTQKSRKVWDVRFAELWELSEVDGELTRIRRLGNWDAMPLTLAQDSLSADVTATLVDIGAGISDSDYDGKEIRGHLVLTSSQPGAVVTRAVGELGAAGIISYAPNQRSAWWKDDDRLVRWGHLSSFPKIRSFGFMISLGEARKLQARLAAGEEIYFHANVDASHETGKYRFAQAAIPGVDRRVGREEIILTCHLDHPRPGANDNASGCVAILETARTLSKLIRDGLLPRPARTIRFLWPAEIEGSIIYLSQREDTDRIKANIHMDMVGGGLETKSVFRISGGPMSLPTFIADVGFEIGHFMNEQTEGFASGGEVRFPLIAPEGGKEPLLALMEGISMGSDHDVFREGSWQIPGLYLHDWPDRYIHTNFDSAAMIDPTKLKRAAFIGAVSAIYLANYSEQDVAATLQLLKRNALARSGSLLERLEPLSAYDAAAVSRISFDVERRKIHSIEAFAALPEQLHEEAAGFIENLENLVGIPAAGRAAGGDPTVYVRNAELQGNMSAFGYSYLLDKYGKDSYARLRLPKYSGSHGSSGEYVYETLNLVDGKRTVSEIRDWLTAELGPVPVALVSEYLGALEQIGVIGISQ